MFRSVLGFLGVEVLHTVGDQNLFIPAKHHIVCVCVCACVSPDVLLFIVLLSFYVKACLLSFYTLFNTIVFLSMQATDMIVLLCTTFCIMKSFYWQQKIF